MTARPLLVICCLVAATLPDSLRSQCSDPPVPRAGYQRTFLTDQPITFSDGYKTLANVLYPNATPGPCGWPLLILVHGLSGSRNTPSVEAVALASSGYFVVAYDVRGQGDARGLNPRKGSKLWALDEWIDLAEIMEWAERRFPSLVDSDRIGVFGDSQGGLHAWAAAAYSGRRLPPNTRRTALFPVIKAAVPRFFPPDTADLFTPDGTAFFQHVPGLAFDTAHPIALLDETFRKTMERFVENDDPRGLDVYLRLVPGKDFMGELKTTTVPILSVQGWRDTWASPNSVIDLFEAMPASTPKRLYLTSGPHGEPNNLYQGFTWLFLTESWFKRHLKGDNDPVEKGPPFTLATTPADTASYLSVTSLWRHRMDSAWPPKSATDRRLYLRSLGRLTEQVAQTGEGSFTIQHQVAPNYDARSYRNDSGRVATVVRSIPLQNFIFTTPPFTEETEVSGTPKLSLSVTPSGPDYMVAARLVSISPSQVEVVLSRGAVAFRKSILSTNRITLELGAVNTILPAGYRLRLEVRNLDIQRPVNVDVFHRIPIFRSSTARVDHDAAAQSWLDLPVRPRVVPDIATLATTVSVTDPQPTAFTIRSSAEWEGALYVVILGFSGQGPPLSFPSGDELWLVPDAGTVGFLQAVNRPILSNFAGLIDAKGEAGCVMDLRPLAPFPLELVGLYMQVAPTMFTFERGFEPGVPVRLRLR